MYISSCHMYVYMHIVYINIVFTCVMIVFFFGVQITIVQNIQIFWVRE